jgi:AAA15 family ATPase/GTPase
MNFIQKISLKNFRSFRSKTSFDLGQLTYVIGVNNAGKTNILHGIKAFFDDEYFQDSSFLNRSEFIAKKSAYNKAEIIIDFDLEKLTTKVRKVRLIKRYTKTLSLHKSITYTADSGLIFIEWRINNQKVEKLTDDILWLLKSVKVTYIHPQEGKQLLANVQRRLRQRLLANWGRGAALTHAINQLEDGWQGMRESATKYLSQALSESLQSFWPESSIIIDLPRNFREVVEVSDISFSGFKSAPEITLTAQGTGAQSTVLYLAHYILDSDKTLNRGEYHPIWLMEEPESFLHADLLVRLAKQINSSDWLNNIQMLVSTHSPILLASSRASTSKVIWNILENQGGNKMYILPDINNENISQIGKLMGDPNFLTYFNIAQDEKLVFLEDIKKDVFDAFKHSGIPVTKGLGGISEVGNYLDVLSATPEFLRSLAYFIIDNDRGLKTIERHFKDAELVLEKDGFRKYRVKEVSSAYLVLLPEGTAIEELFDEFPNHLQECFPKIWKADLSLKETVPTSLSRVNGKARSTILYTKIEAINMLRNHQDVKDLFWDKVKSEKYKFSRTKTAVLLSLLGV